MCKSNADYHLRDVYSPKMSHDRNAAASVLTTPSQPHLVSEEDVVSDTAKGPCEVCGELIPIENLIMHEVRNNFA